MALDLWGLIYRGKLLVLYPNTDMKQLCVFDINRMSLFLALSLYILLCRG